MTVTDIRPWLVVLAVVVLGWLLWLLSPILMPFAAGALLAYLGNPLVSRLMRRGMKRTWAVGLAFFSLVTSTVLALVLVLPLLWQQVVYLESRLPRLLRWFNREGIPWIEQHTRMRIDRLDMELISQWLSSYWVEAGSAAGSVLAQVARSGMDFMALAGMLALVPVVTFYLLLDWDALLERIRNLVPRNLEPRVTLMARECDEVLAAFLRGQLLVMLALGVIYWLGLQLVGLKLALMIGLLAGLASIIPYFGFAVGIVAATVAALVQFGQFQAVLLVWGVFAVGQAIEGWLLQPYLIGDKIGLHPVAVIFAIMAGGQLFGFFGMLLALPAAAVIMVLLRHAHRQYQQSGFYQPQQPDVEVDIEPDATPDAPLPAENEHVGG
ncbi:MAG: AI-2E family transporter [Moraxellaceae bacterium]|nr:AI-2E family transporter [Moraxellaceae bacterium]